MGLPEYQYRTAPGARFCRDERVDRTQAGDFP
jgi:hypothetical protein